MENKSNGLAVGSLILGIVTILSVIIGLFAFWPMLIIGLITGIIGIILGVMAKKRCPGGMATAGLVLSIIGLVFCGIFFIACVACAGIIGATLVAAA